MTLVEDRHAELAALRERRERLATLVGQRNDRLYPTPGALAQRLEPLEANPPHLELLDEKLRAVAEGRIKRLLVTMPPRHGKSRRCSLWFAVWFLMRWPNRRVILASYAAEYAAEWGRAVRDVFREHDLGVRLSADSTAASRWNIEGHAGGMVTAGAGGPLTGRGAHLLIIDDPVKNDEEAASETMRDKLWNWYGRTAYTRLEPGGGVVLIQTRWHEDDLAGRLLAHEGDKWEVLNLPALAEEGDPLGRPVGAALWPDRYDVAELAEIRATPSLGSYGWAALYQQRPVPEGGGFFRRATFRTWHATEDGSAWLLDGRTVDPDECWRFATVDLAASEKTSADWSVCAIWAVTPTGDMLLIDRGRARMDESRHAELVRPLISKHRVGYVGIEKSFASSTLAYEMGRAGIPVVSLRPDTDKVTRAIPAQGLLEAGRVWWPSAAWIEEWEHELLSFPNGKHDDQVDTFAYAAQQVVFGARGREKPVSPAHDSIDAVLAHARKRRQRHEGGLWK